MVNLAESWSWLKRLFRGPFPKTMTLPSLTPDQGNVSFIIKNVYGQPLTVVAAQKLCICPLHPEQLRTLCPPCHDPNTIDDAPSIAVKPGQTIRVSSVSGPYGATHWKSEPAVPSVSR